MFAIPGILALLAFIYGRPQEYFQALQAIPFLHLFLGLALFGLIVDVRLRLSRVEAVPQFRWVLAFFAWCVLTVLVRARTKMVPEAVALSIPIALCLVIAHGVQTFRAFQVVAGTLVALAIFLSAVGVHQGNAPFECVAVAEAPVEDRTTGRPDGRACTSRGECEEGGEPGRDYLCERVGVLGTMTIGGRVRYRGVLNDPNELAMALSLSMPLAFAFFERKRSPARLVVVGLAMALILICIVYTRSRSGQLAFAAVAAAYFVRRFGWRGLAAAAVVAAPVLLLGGRSGEEADSSSAERIGCWADGLDLARQFPLLGAGKSQYTDYNALTAHNVLVLVLAELGPFGLLLWSSIVYLSVKIPLSALRRFRGRAGAEVALSWAMALLASLAGLLVSGFFLSLSYHYVLWIYIGIAGSLYLCGRRHDPGWRVRFGVRDLLLVGSLDVVLLAVIFVITRVKGA